MKDYIEIYKGFLSNEQLMKTFISDEKISEDLEVLNIEIVNEEGFPYIIIESDTDEKFAAAMVGITLDTNKYKINDFKKDLFYLPVILTPVKMKDKLKDYGVDFKQSLVHEKLHVKRIINWITDEPSYIDNFLSFGFDFMIKDNNLEEKKLEKSIDFEIRKIFYLEPEALTSDFESGEDTISVPSFLGGMLEYKCETVEEFLLWQLTNYITSLQDAYEKFSDKKDKIKEYFNKYVNKYGTILGENPYDMINKQKSEFVNKMLSYSVKKKMKKKE